MDSRSMKTQLAKHQPERKLERSSVKRARTIGEAASHGPARFPHDGRRLSGSAASAATRTSPALPLFMFHHAGMETASLAGCTTL